MRERAKQPDSTRCDRRWSLVRQDHLWSARPSPPSLVATGEGPGMGASSRKMLANGQTFYSPIVPDPFGTTIKNDDFKFFMLPSQFRRDKVLARAEHGGKKRSLFDLNLP